MGESFTFKKGIPGGPEYGIEGQIDRSVYKINKTLQAD